MKHLLLSLSLILILFSCKCKPADKTTDVKADATQVTNVEQTENLDMTNPYLVIERTACFGRCPSYKMEIYNDRIEYNGFAFVEQKGENTIRLSDKEFEQIKEEFEEISFETLNDQYNSNIADIPYLIVSYNGKKKHFLTGKKERDTSLFNYVTKLESNVGVHSVSH